MVKILDEDGNPALGELLKEMRSEDLQTDRHRFRHNMRLISSLLGYRLASSLGSQTETIKTPLGLRKQQVLVKPPVLATALRAGLPFLDGMLEIFKNSDVMFVGAARVEGETSESRGKVKVELSYQAMPACHGHEVIFVDPMIATGTTIIDIHRLLVAADQQPAKFIVAGLVGCRSSLEMLEAEIPNCEVWCATADEELDENFYIVPGLGDAGDLCYGVKLKPNGP